MDQDMTKIKLLAVAAVLAIVATLGIGFAPSASAYQLAPNSNIHRLLTPGYTSSDASYGTYYVPYAKQTLRGYGIMPEYSWIKLVYYNTYWGTLHNVTCQHGYTGPSYEPGGYCTWNPDFTGSTDGTEQATFQGAGSTYFTGFGMQVVSRAYWGNTQYNDNRNYSAVG